MARPAHPELPLARSAAMDTELIELWLNPSLTNSEIAAQLGISPATLTCRARKAGLPRRATGRKRGSKSESVKFTNFAPWAPDEDATLKRMWLDPQVRRREIAATLGRGLSSLDVRARWLGLGRRPWRQKGRPVLPADMAMVEALRDEGLTLPEVALRVGVSRTTLGKRIKAAGAQRRQR